VIEAHIKCLCPEIRIPDLGLKLLRGDEVWVDESKSRRSIDLQHARTINAVAVQWKERCRVTKSPAPPYMKRLKPNFGTPPEKPEAPTAQQDSANKALALEVAELKAMLQAQQAAPAAIEAAVGRAVQKALAQEMAGMRVALQARQEAPEAIAVAVERAMQKALAGLGGGSTGAPEASAAVPAVGTTVSSDEPLFIPTNIVDKDKQSEIAISAEESLGSSVDAATEALKKVKKPRRRRAAKKKENSDD